MFRFPLRQPARILTVAALVPVAVLAPAPDPAAPHPVAPVVSELPVTGVDSASVEALPGPRARPPRLLTRTLATRSFSAVGVTWATDGAPEDVGVQIRTRAAGRWSSWQALHADPDEGPDATSADGRGARAGTAPLWVGPSDGVQVRVDGVRPRDVKVALVDPGRSPADVRLRGRGGVADAAADQPAVVTRAQWGADESMRTCSPSYGRTIKAGFVHHTAGSNNYTAAEAPAVVRSIYAFHVKSRGWCDVGYQFLVDRYGVVYEGRYGGIDRPVIGAHAAGLNTDTFGVSLIGDFTTVQPPDVMLTATEKVLAWKLAMHYREPTGTVMLTSGGGGTARYPAGTTVKFNVISGHRDGNNTSCPGDKVYARLGEVRSAVSDLVGPGLLDPVASPTTATAGEGPVRVTAGVRREMAWTVEVADLQANRTIRRWTGTTATSLDVSWDLAYASGPAVPPGRYRVDVTGTAGEVSARPWSTTVTVSAGPDVTSPTPTATPVPTDPVGAPFVPVSPSRVLDTRWAVGAPRAMMTPNQILEVDVTGVGGVPDTDVSAVVLNLTGTKATAGTYLTAFPAGASVPQTSSLSLAADSTAASMVVAGVGRDGKIALYNRAGSVHAIADVLGYYPGEAAGALYHPVLPDRLLDTRRTGGGGAFRAEETRTVRVAAEGSVPSSATAAILNVTAVAPTVAGYLTVSPTASSRSGTSSVNYVAGQTVPNRVVVPLASDGSLAVYNSHGATHVLVDVIGWYAAPSVAAGAGFSPVALARALDTRTTSAPIGPGAVKTLPIAGLHGVPANARAVVVTLAAVQPTHTSHLTSWAAGAARPGSSDLNYTQNRTVSNLSVVQIGDDGAINLYNSAGWSHLLVDVVGWYG